MPLNMASYCNCTILIILIITIGYFFNIKSLEENNYNDRNSFSAKRNRNNKNKQNININEIKEEAYSLNEKNELVSNNNNNSNNHSAELSKNKDDQSLNNLFDNNDNNNEANKIIKGCPIISIKDYYIKIKQSSNNMKKVEYLEAALFYYWRNELYQSYSFACNYLLSDKNNDVALSIVYSISISKTINFDIYQVISKENKQYQLKCEYLNLYCYNTCNRKYYHHLESQDKLIISKF